MTQQEWMSINEYARNFGISDMTIRRRIRTGKLNAILRDGKYYINIQDSQASTPSSTPAKPPLIASHPQPISLTSEEQLLTQESFTAPTWQPAAKTGAPATYRALPPHLTQSTQNLDLQKLLEFCDRALHTNNELIQGIEDRFRVKEKNFQLELQARDVQIEQLKQQLEDLQTLVSLFEERARGSQR